MRPTGDVLKHMFLYYVGILLGYDSALYVALLKKLNAPFDSWDETFAARGLDAAEEVRKSRGLEGRSLGLVGRVLVTMWELLGNPAVTGSGVLGQSRQCELCSVSHFCTE